MTDLSVELVEALLTRVEGPTLEFKESPLPLGSKAEKATFAKDVLAFANSIDVNERAFIVYGVRDQRAGGGVAPIPPESWPSAETVTQVLADYTVSPPRASFRVISTSVGSVGVLAITGVSTRPHHAVRAHDGILDPRIVYLRRDNVNGIATSREIEDLIRQSMASGGRRPDHSPLRIGFVGRERSVGMSALLVRITNVTDVAVAGIEVFVDFKHMSEPGLAARHGLLSNLVLGPGETREASVALSDVQMTLRTTAPGTPPQMLRVLASRLGSHIGDWWVDATLRVYFRDNDGFLAELTSSLALDG